MKLFRMRNYNYNFNLRMSNILGIYCLKKPIQPTTSQREVKFCAVILSVYYESMAVAAGKIQLSFNSRPRPQFRLCNAHMEKIGGRTHNAVKKEEFWQIQKQTAAAINNCTLQISQIYHFCHLFSLLFPLKAPILKRYFVVSQINIPEMEQKMEISSLECIKVWSYPLKKTIQKNNIRG